MIEDDVKNMKRFKFDTLPKTRVEFVNILDEISCFNCYQNSAGESNGKYNEDTGTKSFSFGSLCPVCHGKGVYQETETLSFVCYVKTTTSERDKYKFGYLQETEKIIFMKMEDFEKINSVPEVYIDGKRYFVVDIPDEPGGIKKILLRGANEFSN